MNTSRRTLILGTTALFPLALLAACAGQTQSQLQQDVTLVADGLSGVTAALAALPGNPVPADVLAKINSEIDIIKTNAAAIATAATPSPSVVTSITAAIQAIVPLATPFFPAAPLVAGVVTAAMSLVRVILTSAGIAGAALTSAPAPTMAPAQARLVLARGA